MKFIMWIILCWLIITTSIFGKSDWQQSEISNIQLSVRNKSIEGTKPAKFKITGPEGKVYQKEISGELGEWIKVYFPGDFDEFTVKKGIYSWSCDVDSLRVAFGKFSFDDNMNLKVLEK